MFPCLKEWVAKNKPSKMADENEWSKMAGENGLWHFWWFQWNIDALRPESNYFGEWKSKEAYPIRMHLWINNRVHGWSPVGIGPDLPESIPLRKEINLQRFNFK